MTPTNTQVEATPEVVAPTVDKKVAIKPKPARKIAVPSNKLAAPKAAKVATPVAAIADAPKVRTNAHVESGVDTSAWTGPSDMINKNRAVRIMMRQNVGADDLTDRQRKSLYALRKCYNGRAFPAKGFDNGVMAFLVASGMVALSGGQDSNIDGKPYKVDGATPVLAKVTAVGLKFGTA